METVETKPRFISMLGKPGAGKGTLGRRLSQLDGVAYLDFGQCVRDMKAGGSETSAALRGELQTMKEDRQNAGVDGTQRLRGTWLSDELCLRIVEDAASRADPHGKAVLLLDGFPRKVSQASMLESAGWVCQGALHMDVTDDVARARLAGRLIHASSGRTYNATTAPPRKSSVDDVTGEALVRRPEDDSASLDARFFDWSTETATVIDYYKERGLLAEVDAAQSMDGVAAAARRCLGDVFGVHGIE